MKTEIRTEDKELIKKLNKDGKYTEEYIQSRINIKRFENLRNNKQANEDIENIDLSIEHASKDYENKYSRNWIEKQIKK
jgi:hypothetical protein